MLQPCSNISGRLECRVEKGGGGMQVVAKHMSKEVIANSTCCIPLQAAPLWKFVRRANTTLASYRELVGQGGP